jgi:Zn-dependent protease
MSTDLIVFQLVTLVMSASVHEFAHGWAAFQLGDPTAKDAGRLTANPLKHLDPFGSFLLPGILYLTGAGFLIGYAKPVPYNPYNLSDQRYGSAKVAAAGPLSNLVLAVVFGLLLRAMLVGWVPGLTPQLASLLAIVVQINILLMVFNLLPLPTLDGSKILSAFLPYKWQLKFEALEPYGFIIALTFVMFGFGLIMPVLSFLFGLIVGA